MADGYCVAAMQLLQQLEHATVDEHTLAESDRIVRKCLSKKIRVVATCNSARAPLSGELVILYGNYPLCYESLIVNAVARRHSSLFWTMQHDVVESHSAWQAIERIYIINIPARIDRFDAILNELARPQAPFDRIEHVPAMLPLQDVKSASARARARQEACLMSHISVLERARDSGRSHILVLEDDFCFTSDLDIHLRDLARFFYGNYDYWVCLLASSKYGVVVPKDELVTYSLQPCTNTTAYLISAAGIDRVLPTWKAALQDMKETGVVSRNAVDRSWSCLQESGKFLLFRRKMGLQQSSWSDIEGKIARDFD